MLSQTIRFQRTAWQNSLAIITAVQQHGEKLLKTTIQQSSWIPGSSKEACLFWADIWTKNLAGMTDLVDKNLADMERLSSTGEQATKKEKPPKKASVNPPEPPPPQAAARKPISEKKTVAVKPQAAEKAMPSTKPAVELPKKPAVEPATKPVMVQPAKPGIEQAAAVKTTAPKAPVPEQPPGKQPTTIEKPIGLKA
jgi:hypothetical protein